MTSISPPHVSTLAELHAPPSKALPVSPVGEAPLPAAHLTFRRAGWKLQARSRLSAVDTMNHLHRVTGAGPFKRGEDREAQTWRNVLSGQPHCPALLHPARPSEMPHICLALLFVTIP